MITLLMFLLSPTCSCTTAYFCLDTGMHGNSVSFQCMPSLPAFRFLLSMQVMRTASSSMPTMMRAGTTKAMMYSCGGSRS